MSRFRLDRCTPSRYPDLQKELRWQNSHSIGRGAGSRQRGGVKRHFPLNHAIKKAETQMQDPSSSSRWFERGKTADLLCNSMGQQQQQDIANLSTATGRGKRKKPLRPRARSFSHLLILKYVIGSWVVRHDIVENWAPNPSVANVRKPALLSRDLRSETRTENGVAAGAKYALQCKKQRRRRRGGNEKRRLIEMCYFSSEGGKGVGVVDDIWCWYKAAFYLISAAVPPPQSLCSWENDFFPPPSWTNFAVGWRIRMRDEFFRTSEKSRFLPPNLGLILAVYVCINCHRELLFISNHHENVGKNWQPSLDLFSRW